jgi:ribosomal subunit interface protein
MEVNVRAHSFDLSDRSRQYAESKIGRSVTKLVKGGAPVDVEVSEQNKGTGPSLVRVKVSVAIPRSKPAVVTAEDGEIRAAIDLAADKIGRALRRTKEKRRGKGRTSPEVAPVDEPVDEIDDEAETPEL